MSERLFIKLANIRSPCVHLKAIFFIHWYRMFAVWPLLRFYHFLIVLEKQELQWLSVLDFALKRKINII